MDRWVDLVPVVESPWTRGLKTISVPIAHGEGKYILPEEGNVDIAFKYTKGPACEYQNLPMNPNGSTQDIAGVLSPNGRILGMMPHPERGLFFHQRPDWQKLQNDLKIKGKKMPKYGDGFQLLKNAISYYNKRSKK